MAKLIDTNRLDWQPVRPELTSGVTGKALLDGSIKMGLTRLEPRGNFRPHFDTYGHLFYVLSGQALVHVEKQEYLLSVGEALQVEAGELHGYENCGKEELLLISLNLPMV